MPLKQPKTILDVLDHWAGQAPSQSAFRFLMSGDASGEFSSITFEELHQRARALAMHLRERCLPRDRVLLLYPPGIEYIVGLLGVMYAGAIAVPAYPPDRRSPARLLTIADDAKPAIALTTPSAMDRVTGVLGESSRTTLVLTAEELGPSGTVGEVVDAAESDIAFLQYTSGSTATPRGVCVTHANLIHNQRMIQGAFGSGASSCVVGWLPLYHDMGLVGNVLHSLYLGVQGVLMAPAHFMQRPARWLEAISAFRGTLSGGPDSAFARCADVVSAEDKQKLDLSSWTIAFNGSERVRTETMARFAEAFGPCGFRSDAFLPCYGLAEATLIVSGGHRRHAAMAATTHAGELLSDSNQMAASCGRAVCDTELRIVDMLSRRSLPERTIGEIWVSGPSVAAGYWANRNQAKSGSTFEGRLDGNPESLYLRTGDLGFLCDGELFPTGRLKDLIVIDGVNHFPEDLERTAVDSDPSLVRSGAAAFAVEDGLRERVVIVLEVRHAVQDVTALANRIRRAVASEHGIGVDALAFIRAASLPRTSSGKTQRHETKKRYLNGQLRVVAEWRAMDEINRTEANPGLLDTPPGDDEIELACWIARQAGRALGGLTVSVNEPLSRTGLDSLAAATIAHHVEATLGVPLPMDLLFSDACAADIAKNLVSQQPATAAPDVSADAAGMTPGQTSLWLLHALNPTEDPYHIAARIRITGLLNREAATMAVEALGARHSGLRTTFSNAQQQHVADRAEVVLRVVDAFGWPEERLQSTMIAAIDEEMDLARGPLVRFILYAQAPEEHVLLIVAHHIICDGWSLEILQHDFARFYAAQCAGPVSVGTAPEMASYYKWQKMRLRMPDTGNQVSYWKRQLESCQPLPIPPGSPGRKGALRQPISILPEQAGQVSRLAQQLGVSRFVLFASVLQAALHRLTLQQDIIFGTDTANRPHAWMRNIVGMLSNQLVVRGSVPPDASFTWLVERNRTVIAEALRHQDIPFSWVVGAVNPRRHAGRNPIFQLMFAYRNRALADQRIDELLLYPSEMPGTRPRFDITLALTHAGDSFAGFWEFSAAAVDPQWADRLVAVFDSALRQTLMTPSLRVCELLDHTEAAIA